MRFRRGLMVLSILAALGGSARDVSGQASAFMVPRGNMNLYAAVRYLTASIDGYSTSFVPITAGVTIPLGSKK